MTKEQALQQQQNAKKNNLITGKTVPQLADMILGQEAEIKALKARLKELERDLNTLARVYEKYQAKKK